MPAVTRQGPAARQTMPARVPPRNGKPPPRSILDRAIPVERLEEEPVKILIYGQNRVGKTTLACQFPKPLLLVSFEPAGDGGARSVRRVPGVTYLHLDSTAEAAQLAAELRDQDKFKTVVLDGATSYQDVVLRELLDLDAVPEQLNWGTVSRDQYRERSERTREGLRPFLALPCSTVVLAKERDHNPPDREKPKMLRGFQVESFLAADLGGATVGWLQDACGSIVRLYHDKETKVRTVTVKVNGRPVTRTEEVETGRIVRRLRTMYHPNIAAGLRSETPESVPEWIEAVTPQEMYEKLIEVIKGQRVG